MIDRLPLDVIIVEMYLVCMNWSTWDFCNNMKIKGSAVILRGGCKNKIQEQSLGGVL